MKQPVVEFKDFGFQYHAQANPTLRHINLTIYKGEKVLIVGPSGSGKSTLAHCINGLVPFFYKGNITGSLKVMGDETKEKSIFHFSNHVGTVLQDPDGQFVGLTVAEDIAFKLENDCVPQEELKARVQKVAKLVGIENQLSALPQSLSGGQKQRVTLGGVMVNNVEILLFDEPLASLDPATGKTAIALIDEIKKSEDKTVIIVEHRLEDVLYKEVDRIIVVAEGTIVMDTTPAELLEKEVLNQMGIREPLYITALKYAGCNIKKEDRPENINSLNIEPYKEALQKWAKEIKSPPHSQEKEVILAFENVSFGYEKKKELLSNLSFEVYKGEMLSIVGKNGAGKSTLSKLICGFYPLKSGRIVYKNQDLNGQTIKERSEKIGMVMQNPNQMISQTMIFDEVALGLRVRGVAEEEVKRRVFKALKICGLYQFRSWPISALSFGQKKRVTIAAILVLEPEIIILDEPTAGQDFKHYTEIMEFLKGLNEKGITIIMITHDMHLMLEYTDRAIVLADGIKLADAVVTDILTNQTIIEKANLKETSLYDLALKAEIKDPKLFVKSFIEFDRKKREENGTNNCRV